MIAMIFAAALPLTPLVSPPCQVTCAGDYAGTFMRSDGVTSLTNSPTCDRGWLLVLDLNSRPKCARPPLKEPGR